MTVAEENRPCVKKPLQMTDDHGDITRLKVVDDLEL